MVRAPCTVGHINIFINCCACVWQDKCVSLCGLVCLFETYVWCVRGLARAKNILFLVVPF